MNTADAKVMTQLVIICTVVFLSLYNIAVGLWFGSEATISCVLLEAVRKHPILSFSIGVLVGHVFWPALCGGLH